MTTNKPTTYWAPSTALHKLESRHNNAPCVLTDGPAEFNDVALVRLSDYEALQAELAGTERDYLTIIEAQDAEHRKQVARLQAECEKLRAAMIEAKGHISHYMYGGSSYREPAAKAIELIDDALQEAAVARSALSAHREQQGGDV